MAGGYMRDGACHRVTSRGFRFPSLCSKGGWCSVLRAAAVLAPVVLPLEPAPYFSLRPQALSHTIRSLVHSARVCLLAGNGTALFHSKRQFSKSRPPSSSHKARLGECSWCAVVMAIVLSIKKERNRLDSTRQLVGAGCGGRGCEEGATKGG
ncbi:hypothetical protein GQ54DRAFT_172130 [Martensiomyces pterosporus]|nr:hypothetical protein GQ54DRAFT_172130 [Martensiomyces pterosporus]